jgi:hypothetical protein
MDRHRQHVVLYILLISLGMLVACSGPSEKPAAAEKVAAAPSAPQPAVVAPAPTPAPPREEPRMASTSKAADSTARKSAPRPAKVQAPARVTSLPPAQAPAAPSYEPPPRQVTMSRPEPPPPPPPDPEPVIRKVTLPAGTMVNVRMIDSINSDTDHVNQSFKASLDSPILVNDEMIVPKGSDVYVKLVEVHSAGNMSGKSELRVQLERLIIGGDTYKVVSNVYIQEGASQTTKTARNVGITTAIGAAIGAIAGGKKGAVIGAGAGAGGGAAVEAATKGEQVRIESESPLTFRLESPIEVTLSHESPRPRRP